MANKQSKKPSSPAPPPPDDDWQKGVPYAKADPYTGPTSAAMRSSKIIADDAGTRIGEITGGLQGVQPTPISVDEFNKMARGGAVRRKSWQNALAQHQQRKAANATNSGRRQKPKGAW